MKKWLITYLFFVCNTCLSACVFANAVKTGRTSTTVKSGTVTSRAFAYNKPGLSLPGHPGDNSRDIFFQHDSTQVAYSAAPSFIAAPNFLAAISRRFPGEINTKKEVERVLKDHLLHIFPSHYFW